MELRHLRYFVAVADTLNFRKAAETLHISQPPLSLQIKDLERHLGTDLFIREKRTVRLTEAGKTFLVRARKILKDAEQAKSDAVLAGQGKLGSLSIRFMSSAVTGTLQKLISNFRKAYPLITLDLEQSNVEAIVRDVHEGRIDIGFVRIPVYLPDDLMSIIVLRESYYVALPASHKLSKKRVISPGDLKAEKLIIYPRNTAAGSFDDILSIFTAQNVVPEITQEAVEQLTIAGLVATGMGYSIVPECMMKIRVPGIAHVPFKGGKGRTGMAVVIKKVPTSIAKAFSDTAREFPKN